MLDEEMQDTRNRWAKKILEHGALQWEVHCGIINGEIRLIKSLLSCERSCSAALGLDDLEMSWALVGWAWAENAAGEKQHEVN